MHYPRKILESELNGSYLLGSVVSIRLDILPLPERYCRWACMTIDSIRMRLIQCHTSVDRAAEILGAGNRVARVIYA